MASDTEEIKGIKEKGTLIYAGVFIGWALFMLTAAIYLRPALLVGDATEPGIFRELWGIVLGFIGGAGTFWSLRAAKSNSSK